MDAIFAPGCACRGTAENGADGMTEQHIADRFGATRPQFDAGLDPDVVAARGQGAGDPNPAFIAAQATHKPDGVRDFKDAEECRTARCRHEVEGFVFHHHSSMLCTAQR